MTPKRAPCLFFVTIEMLDAGVGQILQQLAVGLACIPMTLLAVADRNLQQGVAQLVAEITVLCCFTWQGNTSFVLRPATSKIAS
jgi:hypothetical protein